MNLINLTPEVRQNMAAEVLLDVNNQQLYVSPRLAPEGVRDYPGLLNRAVTEHGIDWLARELRANNRLNAVEPYIRDGITRTRKVASNAAEMMAEGEFNRFYCRGLCLDVLAASPIAELEVYRAKAVTNPRPESERLIGTRVKAMQLLADLRANPGVDTALGVPAGPNSGLSVRIPAAQ